MERSQCGGDFHAGVAPQGRIDLLEDARRAIHWKLRRRGEQGLADIARRKIATLRADRQHARSGATRSARHQNHGRMDTAHREMYRSVASPGEVVRYKQAVKMFPRIRHRKLHFSASVCRGGACFSLPWPQVTTCSKDAPPPTT